MDEFNNFELTNLAKRQRTMEALKEASVARGDGSRSVWQHKLAINKIALVHLGARLKVVEG